MKESFMMRAIELAKRGIQARDGGPFGAVVVKDGQVVGEGWNRVLSDADSTAHGEIVAIRDACKRMGTHSLEGCEIYTTGEPCPMCLGAIYWARMEKVYYGFSIKEAAAIGFDDVNFHQEMKLDPEKRSIPSKRCCSGPALDLLNHYQTIPNREHY